MDIIQDEVAHQMSEDDVNSALSSISRIPVDKELANMLLNGVGDYILESAEDLKRFYMMRHNWMHYLVCMNFSIRFSESFTLEDYLNTGEIPNHICLESHKYWDLIRNQTPDIIKMDSSGTILLLDVTVRASEERAKKDKLAKYLTMQHDLWTAVIGVRLFQLCSIQPPESISWIRS
jgi:hypothetical protein